MGGTSSKQLSYEAETYYKNSSTTNIIGEDNSPKEGVQLTIIIKAAEWYVDYSVSSYISETGLPNDYKLLGNTEILQSITHNNESIIPFQMTFILDYYFEKQQHLLFKVRKGSSIIDITTTLGNVMGSRGQVLSKPLSQNSNEQLAIIANTLKNSNISVSMTFSAFHNVKSPSPLFYVIKKENKGTNSQVFYQNVYKSEVKYMNNKGNIPFNNVKIPSGFLCNGEFSNNIIIEFHDTSNQILLGSAMMTVDKLLSDNNGFIITDKKNKGALNVQCKCSLVKEYTFLDYVKGGMQLALSIGVDFTGSNGNPSLQNSLHYINPNSFNAYEKAIRSCGDIVAYYDYDQLFPVYGYGAILPGTNYVNHCFSLNFTNDPNINTIDGVLMTYRSTITKITLNGPTLFAPLINQVINTVRAETNPMVYHILLILTDGMINDMDNTIDALVEASYMPISVIIVGIGKADFGNMDILDADDKPLFDRSNRKAARDLVQFVPFYKFENNGKKLAEEVLEEIPRQVVDYYKMKNMPPGDPIVYN